MAASLTTEMIESVIGTLPIHARIMLRLLLIQYLDLTQEDIEYIAKDRPDPRFQSGQEPRDLVISREAVQSIADRFAQYRMQVRYKRERLRLQIDYLRKQIAQGESLCSVAEELFRRRFNVPADRVQELTRQARAALSKPAIRELDRAWEADQISEEDYRRERLAIEYQTRLRQLERERRRFETARHEQSIASTAPLQDHEVGHVWGIPAGTLAARKAKALQQYLDALQARCRASGGAATGTSPSLDLWKETFTTLAQKPIERSVAVYDGREGTEGALLDKLKAFTYGSLPEDVESRFWLSIVQDTRAAVEHTVKIQSLFSLQRLCAIQDERDTTRETLEQDLLDRITPRPKAVASQVSEQPAGEPQLGEMGQHVLKSMLGEERQ
jgi:hypothetical protein